jgi:hypothetical protein
MLREGWAEAKAVHEVLDSKGFWSCDVSAAANRKLSQKLKEVVAVEFAGDDPAVDKDRNAVRC